MMRAFRFDPPAAAPTARLEWVLRAAFSSNPPPLPDSGDVLTLAGRLGLLPRLAARQRALSGPMGERLARERARAIGAELQLDATLEAAAEVASRLGIELVLLKGRALSAAGLAAPGARPSGDLDLLVGIDEVGLLHHELRRQGFDDSGASDYAHHSPTLHLPGAANLETPPAPSRRTHRFAALGQPADPLRGRTARPSAGHFAVRQPANTRAPGPPRSRSRSCPRPARLRRDLSGLVADRRPRGSRAGGRRLSIVGAAGSSAT